MAIFSKRARPKKTQTQLEKERRERKEAPIPVNSFYVSGGGKTYEEYLESPENRCIAGLTTQKE